MKIYKAYDNQLLKDALKDRDQTYQAIIDDLASFDLDDRQLVKVNRYKKLTQFQRDLVYLRSIYSVKEIAELYAVSKTIIYNHLKQIKNIL